MRHLLFILTAELLVAREWARVCGSPGGTTVGHNCDDESGDESGDVNTNNSIR